MRNAGLDILRFLAVFLVLGRHLHLPSDANLFLRHWQIGGWVGVDLFFVLSGFLVSGLLFKEYKYSGKIDFKRFLIRRGLKIYPAFYFLILITLIILVYSGQGINLKKLFSEIFFLQNYFTGIHSHTWSLAVEEQFYILIALLFIFILKYKCKGSSNPFSFVPGLFAICFFVCSFFRIFNLLDKNDYSHAEFLYPLHLRADSLMFGVLISYHFHFNGLKEKIAKVKSIYLISAAIILFAPVFIFPLESYNFISVFWLAPLYVASGLLLIVALRIDVVNTKVLIITTSLGAASYSIYLWHIPVGTWGWALFKKISPSDSFLVYFLFYIIGSYLIGWIFFKIFEFPILKMRDKLIPSTTGRSA